MIDSGNNIIFATRMQVEVLGNVSIKSFQFEWFKICNLAQPEYAFLIFL